MGNLVEKKFTWVIQNFSSLQISEKMYSDQFVIDGRKWRLTAIPQRSEDNSLSLYLEVADCESLPSGWIRYADFTFTVVNHFPERFSIYKGTNHCFNQTDSAFGYMYMLPLDRLEAQRQGFLMDGEVMTVAVEVFHVVGKLDVPEESEEATQTLFETLRITDDGAASSGIFKIPPTDWVDVNGFQILSSQVNFARRVFQAHPEIALECRTKNQELRTSYMNVLLTLIKMLEKWPLEHSEDDLSDAKAALAYMKTVGFKLDWLEKKIDEVKENQKKCAHICEMEQQLHDMEQKCNDLRTLRNKYRDEMFKDTFTRTFVKFDDLSS